MTQNQLFTRKGPEEPIRGANLGQSSAAYTAGREDYLFGGRFNNRFSTWADRNAYACGFNHERIDLWEAAQGRAQ